MVGSLGVSSSSFAVSLSAFCSSARLGGFGMMLSVSGSVVCRYLSPFVCPSRNLSISASLRFCPCLTVIFCPYELRVYFWLSPWVSGPSLSLFLSVCQSACLCTSLSSSLCVPVSISLCFSIRVSSQAAFRLSLLVVHFLSALFCCCLRVPLRALERSPVFTQSTQTGQQQQETCRLFAAALAPCGCRCPLGSPIL